MKSPAMFEPGFLFTPDWPAFRRLRRLAEAPGSVLSHFDLKGCQVFHSN